MGLLHDSYKTKKYGDKNDPIIKARHWLLP